MKIFDFFLRFGIWIEDKCGWAGVLVDDPLLI